MRGGQQCQDPLRRLIKDSLVGSWIRSLSGECERPGQLGRAVGSRVERRRQGIS
jgi:hypothetical protein